MAAERDTDKGRLFWRTPSGRLHGMRTCSGGCTPRNSKPVRLSPAAFLAAENKCRCARWEAVTDEARR